MTTTDIDTPTLADKLNALTTDELQMMWADATASDGEMRIDVDLDACDEIEGTPGGTENPQWCVDTDGNVAQVAGWEWVDAGTLAEYSAGSE